MKSKKARQAWFFGLSDQEREAWFAKKRAEKRKQLEKTGFKSNCPVFPRIDDSNRQEWQDKILRQNPWLSEEVFEPELEPAEAQHMQSIRHETKARKAISA